jgi:hypothetical protein
MATQLANLSARFHQKFGVSSFFHLDIAANYLEPDGERPYVLYLEQKLPADLDAGLLVLMRRAFHDEWDERIFQQITLNIPRIRKMAGDPDDSSAWESFTAAEAWARWPWFDFGTYFSELNKELKFTEDVKKLMFVVKTPRFFDKMTAMYEPLDKSHENRTMELFKTLMVSFRCVISICFPGLQCLCRILKIPWS